MGGLRGEVVLGERGWVPRERAWGLGARKLGL